MIVESFYYNEIRGRKQKQSASPGLRKVKQISGLIVSYLSLHEYILLLPMTGILRYDKKEICLRSRCISTIRPHMRRRLGLGEVRGVYR